MTNLNKSEIVKKHQRTPTDTGSTEVQCALLTARIKEISDHCLANKHDFQSRRGLLNLVNKRKKLLRYLSRTDRTTYMKLMQELGLKVRN